ncbi:glycoside hydrolase family 2 protein [Dactylosporangium sp. NBC_01737]|uniref:glycoside hydrolase family 2 protein n=1 Tax=Dactylosporangium sp. NBC_01737 TaxID=2975959 RepID=UPI002E12A03E|nr:glycoside hydrolase family 2 protein [Dactylosporangium sp. NBC_01737]
MPVLRPLHSGWTLRAAGPAPLGAEPVPATVPGCVHTDLLAAGLIPDPYVDANELELAWIGRTTWVYETTFDAEDVSGDRVDLVADGLDTVATVTLNGVELGRTANMHRGYRFDVREVLRPTGNRLEVRFDSAYEYALAVRDAVGERPNAYDEPFQYIRKMASNFGWDWGPTLVTAGIWQRIGLQEWSRARLAEVRPLVTVDGGDGVADVHVTVERAGDDPLTLTATVAGVTATATIPAGETEATVRVRVPSVRLWWPRGFGAPDRYDLTVSLASSDGGLLDTWQRRIGFRTVVLDTTADADGTAFTLIVNGVPIFVRGVNWIPDDAFVTRVDRARYATRIGQALDAGVNYLRVWGGGRYESDDFYDLADEHGLLIGQDFLFACAAYPEEEPLGSEVAAEAHEQVLRLMPHPSLVMWVGNNENLWGHEDWNWQEPLAGRTWGAGYYLNLLPGIVAAVDPTRPYWPGSPYSGTPSLHPNDPAHGTTHIWDVWNTHDYRHYATYRPRFLAEFGFQAPPVFATLRRAVSDEPLTPTSPGVLHHQKAADGNTKLARGLTGHLPAPAGFDDWHWTTQLNQARAITFGITHFRSLRPHCMGTILWQLNDNWPVTSWSTIDGDGRRKPLWYALRHAYTEHLLTIQPRNGVPTLIAVNDTTTPWHTEIDVRRITFNGDPRAKTTITIDVPAGGTLTLPLPPEVTTPDDPSRELIVVDGGPDRTAWYFAEDIDLHYPTAATDVVVHPTADGALVEVTARTFVRDLTLFADRLDPAATVDEQLVTLLPGESVTLRVTGAALPAADDPAWRTAPALRTANDLTTR